MDKYLESIVNDKLPLIKYDLFSKYDFINHGFTTRLGGVSDGIYSSLNLSFDRGDNRENVIKNYQIIADEIGEDIKSFTASKQTHTTNVRIITEDDKGKGITRDRDYTDVDGMLTNNPNIVLFTYYADCVPLFFADPVKKIVGMAHSGWRGTAGKIGKVTVEKMVSYFDCKKEDIICAIGPSICKSCYEISEDVAEVFKEMFKDKWEDILEDKHNGHYQLDLWRANELILLEAGITQNHIENRRICTCENSDILFSHRASNGKRGNLAGFIGLKGNT